MASEAVHVGNRKGAGPFVIVCEHATNYIPADFRQLGLDRDDLTRHIAWDPGALPVARLLSAALDAPIVESRISRLVIDCNRPLDAPDLVPEISETTTIPGNLRLTPSARQARIARSHEPFHRALETLLDERSAQGRDTAIVTIHSFTPVYKGVARPWHVGIIHDEDDRLAAPLIERLRRHGDGEVGVNEPYSPADRVYYTLERHARQRGLRCAMVELRNNVVADGAGQRLWADRLVHALRAADGGDFRRQEARSA